MPPELTHTLAVAPVPRRIQRPRTPGWRAPKGVVYVGRRSRWASPFRGEEGAATATREMLADDFRRWLLTPTRTDPRDGAVRSLSGSSSYLGIAFAGRPSVDEIRTALRGRDLACRCPLDQPCHADVLIEVANS